MFEIFAIIIFSTIFSYFLYLSIGTKKRIGFFKLENALWMKSFCSIMPIKVSSKIKSKGSSVSLNRIYLSKDLLLFSSCFLFLGTLDHYGLIHKIPIQSITSFKSESKKIGFTSYNGITIEFVSVEEEEIILFVRTNDNATLLKLLSELLSQSISSEKG